MDRKAWWSRWEREDKNVLRMQSKTPRSSWNAESYLEVEFKAGWDERKRDAEIGCTVRGF